MSGLYPLVEAAVVAACLCLVLFAVAHVAGRRGTWPAMGRGAVGLGWFLVVWELARAGGFEGTRSSAPGPQIAMVIVALALGWALLLSRQEDRPAVADLVALQAVRAVGVVALVALAREALPAWLALPIGLGDPLVGLLALGTSRRLRRAAPEAPRAAARWNLFGMVLAAFVIAAPIASAHSTGYFFSLYPLVLIPTFLAPVSLALHLAIRRGLSARAHRPRG